jgi:glycosyltransferase involved in cell wall biosynthesis
MGMHCRYEIICVDDGSSDGTTDILFRLASVDNTIKVIQFRKNYGQTAAIAAGFNYASGDIIVTLDADLQNKPEDIPSLITLVQEGNDVVCGWRKKRNDKLITRKIPSFIANKIISFVTGVRLHDYGCTLKAFKKKFIKEIELYGEMHRFLPALLGWNGAFITETEVEHAPRLHGKSKYGIFRTFKVILDLITVKLLTHYSTSPIYMFGSIGFSLLLIGVIVFFIIAYRVFVLHHLESTPLVFIMVILFLTAIQVVFVGLLAEINVRIFYETNNKKTFKIEKKINL